MATPSTDVLDLLRRSDPDDLTTLLAAGIIRGTSRTQMYGDYAEYLVASLLDGELLARNSPGVDVLLPDGERVSVKSRSRDTVNWKHFQVRRLPERDFDRLVLVEFRVDWTIAEGREIRWDEIEAVRDYLYKDPKGPIYDRFYRHGKWRTGARRMGLAEEQRRLRYL
jgi:hypothetical protein